ncbi:MAG: Uncharacterized protein Athens071412_412 [Parcubacteria group bacterium Athens0714_12]|nr:MAG: Uncharacterized protein Athens071412_412 [Parcubacteria group bacterium Athens0714_12]
MSVKLNQINKNFLKKIISLILIIIFFNLFLIQIDAQETLPNPIGTTDIKELIARIITTILGLTGAIALVLFVYGGLVWMTSGGSSEKIKEGKNILVWAILGLVVIFTSYIILNFVFETLEKVTK